MKEKICLNCEHWRFSEEWNIDGKNECNAVENEFVIARDSSGGEALIFTSPKHSCSQYTEKAKIAKGD